MKMVNSAYFSLPVRITGVEQALLLLGTEAVKNIAVSAAVSRVFGGARQRGRSQSSARDRLFSPSYARTSR